MTVPTYDKFTEPVLRYLATKPGDAAARDVHETAADALGLGDSQRAKVIASGQLVYRNRAGWAHDRLKHTGLLQSLSCDKWCLTPAGFGWAASHPQPMTKQEANHLAFAFVNVKLRSRPDAVDLDPRADSPDHERLVKSSPDDRLSQALKKFRDAVADEVLENLLRVSLSHSEVIVLDVLHRLGYDGHRDDLQRAGGIGDGGIDGVVSPDELGLEKVYIQTKHWQNTIGRSELQAFYDALAGQKAKRGVFITTSGSTSQARSFAQSVEGIVLVDGERPMHLVIENEVGASSRLLKVPKLDMGHSE